MNTYLGEPNPLLIPIKARIKLAPWCFFFPRPVPPPPPPSTRAYLIQRDGRRFVVCGINQETAEKRLDILLA